MFFVQQFTYIGVVALVVSPSSVVLPLVCVYHHLQVVWDVLGVCSSICWLLAPLLLIGDLDSDEIEAL